MAPVNSAQVRDGIAWATGEAIAPSDNPWIWFWEAIQGDFNESRSTAQILTDAAISMVPGVDQICDLRDLIADSKRLAKDLGDGWAWVALALTLVGLLPSVGSLLKGVLKIVFVFIRRNGADDVAKAVVDGLTWVDAFLRRYQVQKYLRTLKVDEAHQWLANQIRALRGRIDAAALLAAFDQGIRVVTVLTERVSLIPKIGGYAKGALDQVTRVRLHADEGLKKAIEPVFEILDTTIRRLELKILTDRHGLFDTANIHFIGKIPEAQAVTLMRGANPKPSWLSDGSDVKKLGVDENKMRGEIESSVKKGWPPLHRDNIASFHTLRPKELKGPARLYRIIAPGSRAMSDCWVAEDIFNMIQKDKDPRSFWRRGLAVWPWWNTNGQFVVYEVKHGETLKVWEGAAAGQAAHGHHLEGGVQQIVFKIERTDPRNDTMRYFRDSDLKSGTRTESISRDAYDKLNDGERATYTEIRSEINHPNIFGPFDTGWPPDYGGIGLPERIGVPALPGQLTELR